MPRPALNAATVQAAPISDLQTALPAVIDAVLAEIWRKIYVAADEAAYYKRQVDDYNDGLAKKNSGDTRLRLQYSCYTETARDRCQASLDEARTLLQTLHAEAVPYEAEYQRRGGWSRFYKVLNGNGHVHRSRNCTSTFPTTRYGWLYTLSGASDDEAIAEWGHNMCSQDCCFPQAPVEELRRAYETALYCGGSGHEASGRWRAGRGFYGNCPTCRKALKLTTVGTLPKHKKAVK